MSKLGLVLLFLFLAVSLSAQPNNTKAKPCNSPDACPITQFCKDGLCKMRNPLGGPCVATSAPWFSSQCVSGAICCLHGNTGMCMPAADCH